MTSYYKIIKKPKKKKKQVCYTLYIVLLYYSSVSLHDKHIGWELGWEPSDQLILFGADGFHSLFGILTFFFFGLENDILSLTAKGVTMILKSNNNWKPSHWSLTVMGVSVIGDWSLTVMHIDYTIVYDTLLVKSWG